MAEVSKSEPAVLEYYFGLPCGNRRSTGCHPQPPLEISRRSDHPLSRYRNSLIAYLLQKNRGFWASLTPNSDRKRSNAKKARPWPVSRENMCIYFGPCASRRKGFKKERNSLVPRVHPRNRKSLNDQIGICGHTPNATPHFEFLSK
jgi:hypothetical protein